MHMFRWYKVPLVVPNDWWPCSHALAAGADQGSYVQNVSSEGHAGGGRAPAHAVLQQGRSLLQVRAPHVCLRCQLADEDETEVQSRFWRWRK